MSDREETKGGDSPPPPFQEGRTTFIDLFLQEAVYALMAEANIPKNHIYEPGESSRSTLPPFQDSAALKGAFDDTVGVGDSADKEKPRNEEEQTPRTEPVEDIKEKAYPFDITSGVDDSEVNEEKKEGDQRPRSESKQDSWENEVKKEVDEPRNEKENPDPLALLFVSDIDGDSHKSTEEEIEDHRPRSESEQGRFGSEVFEPRAEPEEADAFALMLLSGVARKIRFWKNLHSPGSSVNRPPFNPNDESLENDEEDQKLRREIANWYAENMYNESNKEISSLTDVMKAFELQKMQKQDGGRWVEGTLDYINENEQMHAGKILGMEDDIDSHVVEEKTKKSDLNKPWTYLNTEIAILESIIDYKAKKGRYPFTDNTDLADFIKNWLLIDVDAGEFSELIQFLKHKYAKRAGKRPVNVDTPKTKEEKVLELALRIWG